MLNERSPSGGFKYCSLLSQVAHCIFLAMLRHGYDTLEAGLG